jgi:hypothetical protein
MSLIPRWPNAYLLTFSCYGSWLHGDERGSVDRNHRMHGMPLLEPASGLHQHEAVSMGETAYSLTALTCPVVLEALSEVCQHRGWELLAAHVRTQHVHAVIKAAEAPERVLTQIKAYSSRALQGIPGERDRQRRWSRGGSKRYLWRPEDVDAAVHYVVHEQGTPMAVLVANPDSDDGPRKVHGTW